MMMMLMMMMKFVDDGGGGGCSGEGDVATVKEMMVMMMMIIIMMMLMIMMIMRPFWLKVSCFVPGRSARAWPCWRHDACCRALHASLGLVFRPFGCGFTAFALQASAAEGRWGDAPALEAHSLAAALRG